MAYFLFFIEIEEKNWLLAGAGSVALRKARALLSCQARVTVVAPKIDEGFFLLRQENEENQKFIDAWCGWFRPDD